MTTPSRPHIQQPHPHSYHPQAPSLTTSHMPFAPGSASAPLPSPTATHSQQNQYFGSIDAQGRIPPGPNPMSQPPMASHPHQSQHVYANGYPMPQYQQQAQNQTSSAQAQAAAAQQMAQANQPPQGLRPPTYPANAGATAAETSAFLQDYALVAEAAKRAQMACLMRDMEGVEL